MSKEQTDLAACPFCGSDASAEGVVRYSDRHVNEQGWEQNEFYYCNCPRCGVNNCGIVGHSSREKAIAAWNRRALIQPTPAETAVTDSMVERATIQLYRYGLDDGGSPSGMRSATRAALQAAFAVRSPTPPPIGDGEGDLVELVKRLRFEADDRDNYPNDHDPDFTADIRTACSAIESLSRQLEEAREALKPFDQGPMIDLSLLDPETKIDVRVTAAQLHRARTALEANHGWP